MHIGMVKKGKETRLGWDYHSHIVCMCIIMRWSRNRGPEIGQLVGQRDFGPPHYYAHTNYVTIIVPSQSYLLSFLHHLYMRPFSICKIFHLLAYYMHIVVFSVIYLKLHSTGESGLVYKGYLDTALGKELVAVKIGKGCAL